MQRLSLLAGAVALSSITAMAQNLTAVAPGNLANVSCCTSGNIWRAGTNRVQCIYDSTSLNTQGIFSPIEINTLEYRLADALAGAAVTYPSVEIYVQYAASDYLTPNTQFDLNRTVAFPTTPNYAGPVNVALSAGTTPNSYAISIPLTSNFIFDPSLGQDLLVEIVILTAPTPNTGSTLSTGNVPATHLCNSVRSVGSTTAVTGALSGFCPIVRFGYTVPPGVAKHDPYGQGCYTISRSFYEQFPGAFPVSTNDLSNHTVLMFQNGAGGYDVLTTPGATVVAPTTANLGLLDDSVSTPITLPFAFDYPGGSTSTIYVDSNGSIVLNAAAAPASINNSTVPQTLLNAVNHRLYASLQDLNPDVAVNPTASVHAEVDPTNPGIFLITWLNVPPFLTVANPLAGASTFQIALVDNGTSDTVEYRFQSLYNESDSYGGAAITGFSLGSGSLDGGNRDLTAGVVSTALELPPLVLTGSPRPTLGAPVNYGLSNMRPNLGVGIMLCSFGQVNPGLPLPLLGVPAPGCNVYIDAATAVGFGPFVFGSPSASFPYTWPLGPWSGVLLYAQGFELAPLENPAGVISSNGLKIELGNL